MDSVMYDTLMDGEARSNSENDSLLRDNPFDNSMARFEVDMVVNQMRKNSLETPNCPSPLLPTEEKKVNISNLSDLVPEDPVPEKINEIEEDHYQHMLPQGELNAVEEVDEDCSDAVSAPSQDDQLHKREVLPAAIHERADSAAILDMQTSSGNRMALEDCKIEMVGSAKSHKHTPSMTEEREF